MAQGFRDRTAEYRPVAVVDIGSNSVRLVVYDGLRRAPTPVFNEKILCGLGRGVAITGNSADGGIARALAALRRFRTLAKQIGVKQVFAVATAAAREATNGPDFIDSAEEASGVRHQRAFRQGRGALRRPRRDRRHSRRPMASSAISAAAPLN